MSQRYIIVLLALTVLISACAINGLSPSLTATQTPFVPAASTIEPVFTPAEAHTSSPEPTPTLSYPPEGRGPDNFPQDVNPLTGLAAEIPANLERRPIIVKVENLPRAHRPQWGLSAADIVYEYYTEEGTTRFAAIYYGEDSNKVGPIRSGRYFDINLVQGYKAAFVFGYAWAPILQKFQNSDFGNRLILEGDLTSPALYRGEDSILFTDTSLLASVEQKLGIDNSRQNLEGMFFKQAVPENGYTAKVVYTRFSSAIFNQWLYDAESGRYLRSSDAANAFSVPEEIYTPLTDRNTGEQIGAENVVIIFVEMRYVVKNDTEEVTDATLLGSGQAYIARDGLIFPVTWQRANSQNVLTLTGQDGQPFPFKPGQTWFEIMGMSSTFSQTDETTWRFTFRIP